jgi:hypothetical protein
MRIPFSLLFTDWQFREFTRPFASMSVIERGAFISMLKKKPLTRSELNERLWIALLDTATVKRDGKIVFRFKSGVDIIA